MTEKITIRPLIKLEIPLLQALQLDLHDFHRRHVPWMFAKVSQRTLARYLREKLAKDPDSILVAEVSGKIAGYISLSVKGRKRTSNTKAGQFGYVSQICIAKAMRKLGVGSRLIAAAKAWTKRRKLRALELDVWVFNQRAAKFFEDAGFKPYNVKMRALL